MRIKKVLILASALFVIGGGYSFAAQQGNQTQAKVQDMAKVLFTDQDGDGICDFFTDHDNDGIPNCQDPDWAKPQNGTGNQYQKGNIGGTAQFGNRHGFQGSQSMSNQSFRHGGNQAGNGVCTGSGPNGQAKRNGKR